MPTHAKVGGGSGSGAFKIESDHEALVRLARNFAALAAELQQTEMIEILAQVARGQIIERTQAGADTSKAGFVPYSEEWADVRQRVGLQTSPVNLTFSGTMLRSIVHDVLDPLTAELSVAPNTSSSVYDVTPRDEVAEYHQQGSGVPEREWFGLSDDQVADLEKRWTALLLEAMIRHLEAQPLGEEIAQLNHGVELVTEPRGPFASYDEIYGP